MQYERFLDLYITESREHLELLTRSLLHLEQGKADAVDDAFRAAHTIKGLAAAMGHAAAAATAHELEDRLSAVREKKEPVHGELVDALLAGLDRLEHAIEKAVSEQGAAGLALERIEGDDAASGAAHGATMPAGAAAATGNPPGGIPGPVVTPAPPGTRTVAVVHLVPDAALPEARVQLIRRALQRAGALLDSSPDIGERYGGELRLYLNAVADAATVEAAIRACGEVADVRFEKPPRSGSNGIGEASSATAAKLPDGGGRPAATQSRTVRVDRARLDELAEGIAELSVLQARAAQTSIGLGSDRASTVLSALQRTVLDMRMVPVSTAFERFGRLVRDTARATGKDVDFTLQGGEIELDQAVLDALVDPLVHVVRNAVDHGIEPAAVRERAGKAGRGSVRIEAERERNSVRIRVSDDGRGVSRDVVAARGRAMGLLPEDASELSDDEILRLLFHPGFSTAETVTELSGRGVGLNVVAGRIRSLGGAIELSTAAGTGTTFTLRVPVTLALTHALRIRLGEEEYALPITHVSEVIPLEGDARSERGGVRVRGDVVPLVELGRVLGARGGEPSAAIVAELGGRRVALAVDRVLGHEQILVKTFNAPVDTLPVFSGATLLPDGRPALLIDPLSVV